MKQRFSPPALAGGVRGGFFSEGRGEEETTPGPSRKGGRGEGTLA